MKYHLVFIFLFISSSFCFSQNVGINEFYSQDTSLNLYAFIGKKISLETFDPNKNSYKRIDTIDGIPIVKESIIIDEAFIAKYEIPLPIFNNVKRDTIDFVVYDHYGRPNFEKYEFVILYLSKNQKEKSFYHIKYQFDPVKLNKGGKWVGINGVSIQNIIKEKKKQFLLYRNKK